MSDLIERVARAICRANCSPKMTADDVECQVHSGWDMWEAEARAAIAALDRPAGEVWRLAPVEPTEAMWEAAWEASQDYFVGDAVTKRGFQTGLSAMIAAAPSLSKDD